MITNQPLKHCFGINGRDIGPGSPVYIIAEMSANHGQDFDKAKRLLHVAKEAGADAVKLQTYTADTLTIQSSEKYFRIDGGTLWDDRTLYDLYREASIPWSWQPRLKQIADEIGLELFSTPFDASAIDFLEKMDVAAYKVASFEIVDLPLIEKIAQTGKPMILSTGMATLGEIEEAVLAARGAGAGEIALLKCTSAYPAPPNEMSLRTIPHLAETFGAVAGLSDHTLGSCVAVAAVALGACILEKHFCLSRSEGGPDSAFSLEPSELRQLVQDIRTTEQALGQVDYCVGAKEQASRVFRRSLFVVEDVKAGEMFTSENIRSIRPGHGMPPKYLCKILGRCAANDVRRGTPLGWEHVNATGGKVQATPVQAEK